MEDKVFEEFLNQLRSNNPDMSVIKDGIGKYGSGALSDAQKESFRKALYPDLAGDFTTSSQAQGFEDVSALKNVLKAIVEIQKDEQSIRLTAVEGAAIEADKPSLTDETIQSILAPEGGKNALDTLIINTYAADFKSGQITDEDTLNILAENKKEYEEALQVFAQINPQSLQKLLETSRSGEYKAIINSPHYSPTISEFISSAEDNIAKATEGVTIEEAGTTRIGGEGVTVAPAAPATPEGLNITPEEEDEQKTAKIAKAPGDNSKSSYKPEIVREQDIIKYMFEKWFLEFMVSGTINLANKIVDGALNYMAEHLDMPAKDAEYITPNSTSAKYLKTTAKNLQTSCELAIDPQNRFYRALHSCLSDNASKDLADWKIPEFNGQKVLDLTNPQDKAIAEAFKAMYDADPKMFKERMSAMDEFIKTEGKQMATILKTAATIALVSHVAANIDKEFTAEDERKITTRMKVIADQIKDNLQKLSMQTEINYRISHGLTPDAELSQADRVALTKEQQEVTLKYAKDLTDSANSTQDNLKHYYGAVTEEDKEKYKDKVTNDNVKMSNLLEGRVDTPFASAHGRPMTLEEAGTDAEKATVTQEAWDKKLFTLNYEADATANQARKQKFQEKVAGGSEIITEKKATKERHQENVTENIIRSMGPAGMFK